MATLVMRYLVLDYDKWVKELHSSGTKRVWNRFQVRYCWDISLSLCPRYLLVFTKRLFGSALMTCDRSYQILQSFAQKREVMLIHQFDQYVDWLDIIPLRNMCLSQQYLHCNFVITATQSIHRVEKAKIMVRDLEMRSHMDRSGVDMMNVKHPEYTICTGNKGNF